MQSNSQAGCGRAGIPAVPLGLGLAHVNLKTEGYAALRTMQIEDRKI